jgi:hypothetical protein
MDDISGFCKMIPSSINARGDYTVLRSFSFLFFLLQVHYALAADLVRKEQGNNASAFL